MRLIWTRVHREFFSDEPEKFDMIIPGKIYMHELESFVAEKCTLLMANKKQNMNRDKKCAVLSKASTDKGFTRDNICRSRLEAFEFQGRKNQTRAKNGRGNRDNEYLFVLLQGNFSAKTSAGKWETSNGRKDVFNGLPHALYLPRNTDLRSVPPEVRSI